MEVMIGIDPHKGSHTATMLDRAERELTTDHGARRAPPGRSSCSSGRTVMSRGRGRWSAPAGWAICCPSNSSLPASGARCAGDVGVAGAGAGHRPVDQDRSERRPLGRRGGVACSVAGGGATGRSRHGVPAVGQAAHRRGPLADQAVLPAARPRRRAGARRDRQRSGRQPGTITARRDRARRRGSGRTAPPGGRARRRDRTPRRRVTRLRHGSAPR